MAKIYLSGKITGVPLFNRPKFDKYEALLTEQGHQVINPLKISPFVENKTWEEYMKDDITQMLTCDYVAVLDDWKESIGAMIEVLLARDLKMKIVSAETLKPLFL